MNGSFTAYPEFSLFFGTGIAHSRKGEGRALLEVQYLVSYCPIFSVSITSCLVQTSFEFMHRVPDLVSGWFVEELQTNMH